MWTKTDIKRLASTKKFAVVVASVTNLAAGVAIGHRVSILRLEKAYLERLEQEMADTREFYEKKNKAGDFSDPNLLAEKYATEAEVEMLAEDRVETMKEAEERMQREAAELVEAVRELKYHSPPVTKEASPEERAAVKASITKNIFENRDPVDDEEDEFDLEVQKPLRVKNRPYIISHDEFFENEEEYKGNDLTYYEGDDVLCDEREVPIQDVRKLIGDDNLKFGYGSKDNNIVYIRNEMMECNFSVVRSFGKYHEEVLGMGDLEHSDGPKIRKFRVTD